jgi:UDP-N-acetylglucosamine--N-acetylmuramyl-(pentapeptide) pyrophosphoryl-undecaprenol N-acetylglucosamine transferase
MILISEKEIDSLATQGRTEFRFERLPGVGLPRVFSLALFGFLRRFKSGLAQCRALYAKFQPHAVLGMGGFTSTGPILAGRMCKVPTFVHESNAIPGKANKLNARMVNTVLLGFAECAEHFPRARCQVTGTPIRSSLARPLPKPKALAAFGLTPERKTLLVMGGSQGAQGINRAMAGAVSHLNGAPLQIIHLAGKHDEQLLRERYAAASIPAFVAAFHHRMEEAYSAADFCVARSGAASLSELSCFGLPSLLIPYPYAAEDHQTLNAKIFDRAGAATVLHEREIKDENLAGELRWFLDHPARLSEMSVRCAGLAPHGAAERVADTMLQSCAI